MGLGVINFCKPQVLKQPVKVQPCRRIQGQWATSPKRTESSLTKETKRGLIMWGPWRGPVYFVMHSVQTENMIIKVTLHYSLGNPFLPPHLRFSKFKTFETVMLHPVLQYHLICILRVLALHYFWIKGRDIQIHVCEITINSCSLFEQAYLLQISIAQQCEYQTTA